MLQRFALSQKQSNWRKSSWNRDQKRFGSTNGRYSNAEQKKKLLIGVSAMAGLAAVMYATKEDADASADYLHGHRYPWHHYNFWGSYDHAAIRRGFKVYMQVGSACHSMKYIQWRHLVNVCLTEDEAKELAAEFEYEDGPDDEGEMFMRPGNLFNTLPPPYANEQEARYMNDGALPPDLSVIVKARHDEENYIFNLLTGYRDPPAGFELGENMYYNPYFQGAQIAMPPPLQNDMVEYEDGTEASISQMAKDVTTFLAWAGTPELDERHLLGVKAMGLFSFLAVTGLYWKRFIWAPIKNRQVRFLRRTEKALKQRKRNF
eukprot:TRINITY_DN43_c0_g2_i1.p1 TRINITY_DN43_c0_g2~~TRINITY_DN43_c0_g2_i1.p1  ORF type:complete len:318 (-),score=82.39 TRINITY_DN43_c0_g2_i1:33-986(-)